MKLKIILIMLAFTFSFVTNSNQLPKRNLANDNIKFLLIGFGGYSENNFNVTLMKYEAENNYSHIFFNTSVIYQDLNKSDNVPVKCDCGSNYEEKILTYMCEVINDENDKIIRNISLNNYRLIATNLSGDNNLTFNEDEIILSTLANSTRKNIEKETEILNFNIFYLTGDPIIKKNEVELNGNILWPVKNESKYFDFNLSMPENVNCLYYYNYSKTNIYERIIFSPKNDVNIHLNAMMEKTSYSKDHYILIYSNNHDDLILYSNDKYSYIELLGFKNYKKQTATSNANAIAYLRGTLYSLSTLKDFMIFTVNTDNGKNITAFGQKINNEVQNNNITYLVEFMNTSNMDVEPNIFYKDFIFSDYQDNFTDGVELIDIYPEDFHIRNEFNFTEIKFPSKPREVSNGLYFDFTDPNEFKDYTFEKRADAYMSYIPMNENFREIIKCAFVNNTDSYDLICNPQKSFITYMNTLRMSVEGIRKSRRLRFLQTKENITFSSPMNSTELIDYTYDPEFNNFAKKVSKKKGLSAGAIVAIVLSSIAVVAAVGITIFFLNKKEPKPIKNLNNNSYLQNSTSNINK